MFAITEEIEAQRNYEFPYASNRTNCVELIMAKTIKAYRFQISNPSKTVQNNLEQTLRLCKDLMI